ncbi:hypothetical protein D9M70_418910 [compost metagenome]
MPLLHISGHDIAYGFVVEHCREIHLHELMVSSETARQSRRTQRVKHRLPVVRGCGYLVCDHFLMELEPVDDLRDSRVVHACKRVDHTGYVVYIIRPI